jgi:hypothetical protein
MKKNIFVYLSVVTILILSACAKKENVKSMEEQRLEADTKLESLRIKEQQETARAYAKESDRDIVTNDEKVIGTCAIPTKDNESILENSSKGADFSDAALAALLKRQDELDSKVSGGGRNNTNKPSKVINAAGASNLNIIIKD